MDEPLEESYFSWLCAKVQPERSVTHLQLLRILFSTAFVWIVWGDRNRHADGLELRQEFLNQTNLEGDLGWFNQPCSVLEMLIAFSRRAAFQTDIPERDWFWEFLANLRLDEFHRVTDEDIPVIDEILHRFLWRTYESNGDGGMFPMRNPRNDQTKVEIWYQFFEYLEYRGLA